MVSHDRNFIDNVANSIILIDSEGNLSEHVGGFTDNLQTKISFSFKKNKIVKKNSKGAKKQKHERKEKFSYNQEKELVNLSKKIEMLNEEISLAELDLSSPDLIKDSNIKISSGSKPKITSCHSPLAINPTFSLKS